MKLEDIKNTKVENVLVACRIPKEHKVFLDKHNISFSVFAKKALEEFIQTSAKIRKDNEIRKSQGKRKEYGR